MSALSWLSTQQQRQGELEDALDLCRLGRMRVRPEEYYEMVEDMPVMLYFIHNPLTQLIKIGISVEPKKRIISLEAACGCDLVMLAYHYGGRKAEQGLHRRFSKLRRKGEWFEATPELFEAAKLHNDHGIVRVCKKYRVRV